eukprot:c21786_g1_i1 orf=155-1084(+)
MSRTTCVWKRLMDTQWQFLCLVFSCLDGKSLARACCVCRRWQEVASQNTLWKDLCVMKWPSLESESGQLVVEGAGGFRRLYSLRCQAQCHPKIPRQRHPKPNLRMKDILFLLDLSYEDETVFSIIKEGDSLAAMFAGLENDSRLFRFSVNIEITYQPGIGRVVSAPKENEDRSIWTTHNVKEFKASWAIMVRGSDKILQVLQTTKPGQVLGHTCNFSDWLPINSCCNPINENTYVAEVNLSFACMQSRGGGVQNDKFKLGSMVFSLLNTISWRYFTQTEALLYFQHALFHDCMSAYLLEKDPCKLGIIM